MPVITRNQFQSLFIACLILRTSFSFSQESQLHHEIAKIIRQETYLDFDLIPTVIVVSIDGDFIAYDTFGQSLNTNTIVPRDLWELGSISKPVVAYLADQALKMEGKTLESPFCSILPDSLCKDTWQKITIRQVLEHRAGLPLITEQIASADQNEHKPYADYDLAHLIADIKSIDPVFDKYSYSHIGYAALYWLFEKHGGLENLARTIFKNPGINFFAETKPSTVIPGYGLDGKITEAWNTNALTAAIGLKADLYTIQLFLQSRFADLAGEIPVVTPQVKKQLNQITYAHAYKVVEGWFILRSGKSIIYLQNGHTDGHYMSIAFMPKEKKAVIVASNSSAGTKDLSLSVLTMLRRAKKK